MESAVHSSGFKAGQSKDGSLGYQREVAQTLNAHMSALEPTVVIVRKERTKRNSADDGSNRR